jgi:hypothetical protein
MCIAVLAVIGGSERHFEVLQEVARWLAGMGGKNLGHAKVSSIVGR